MKLLSFILALALAQGALSACDADNCARAVTGTRTGKMPDVTSRMRDCSSFMLITVTPPTSTITATATDTTTITLDEMMKRQAAVLEQRQVTVTPSSVPAYASACSGTARYSSACSCWGITATTTTAPTPVTSTTVTVTATVSVCPVGATKCGTSCFNLQADPRNCGACGNACTAGSACCDGACYDVGSDNYNCGRCGTVCASGTTCQSGTCVAPPANCTTYTASCSDVINGVLASNSIASPQLVDYRIQSAILGITSPADFLAALGANPCDGLFTDPSEHATCVDLLATSDFVAELTDIVKGVLTSLQRCAADFADGGSTAPITITEPTCPAPPTVRRNVQKRDENDLTASILADIEHYQSTAVAPALGPKKMSLRSLDLIALSRRQSSTCANTGQCFERCPDCRDRQTYCGTTAIVITTAVCGTLGVAANAIVATVSASACGTACAPLGPGALVCAGICGRAAGGAAALAVGTTCAVARAAICDPLTQRCDNCNNFNNGICDPNSTQCCPGETGTQCGQGCCCCPLCQAPGGINCACTAAPC